MGHVAGAGSGIALLELAVNLAVVAGHRTRRHERLALLEALRHPATIGEASSQRRTVARVLAVVRAQRAVAEVPRASEAGL